MKLKEGLRKGDLEGLVLPLITIDEYESKIDDNTSVVVGFYVFEKDAAHDLSNFVERAPYQVMDTDVSPAPTKDGYYVCFAEINRTLEFPDVLMTLLTDISKLCKIEDWQFTTVTLSRDKILPLNEKNLQKHVRLDLEKDSTEGDLSVLQFFKESALNNASISGGELELSRKHHQARYSIVGMQQRAPSGAVELDESAASECLVLEQLLGGPYTVHKINSQLVIENWQQKQFLILQKN